MTKRNTDGLLPAWIPGQSGNPRGQSEGRRKAKKLRQALDALLEAPIPDVIKGTISPDLLETLPPGVTFAEMIALRVVVLAATATRGSEILAAAHLITQATAKPVEGGVPPKLDPPRLPPTEERRRAVAVQLGLEDEDLTVH